MASTAARQGDNRFNAILQQESHNFNDYLTKGRQLAEQYLGVLRGHADLSIDRCIFGGSVGKRTAPGAGFEPDFDVYPFFNLRDLTNEGIRTAIPTLLNKIVDILKRKGFTSAKKINEFAVQIQVCYSNGPTFSVDIVPAVNFGKGEAQYQEVIRRYARAGTNLRYLGSSRTEKTVEYLDKQDDFTRNVVKLAKIWNEKCVNANFIAGRSTIVELVAVKAAQEETHAMGVNQRTMTSALVRFLNIMKVGYGNIRILFEKDHLPVEAHNKYESRKYETGILIDPINPWINFLEEASVRNGWGYFQNAANTSLTNWNYLQQGYATTYADKMIGM